MEFDIMMVTDKEC